MATSLEPQNKYVDFDEYIDYQLSKTRSNIKSTDIWATVGYVSVFVLAYLLLFVILDQWVVPGGFGIGARVAMLLVLLGIAGGWLIWRVALPCLKSVNSLFAAKVIEAADPNLKHSLLNLVDLQRAGKKVPDSIRRAMEKRAAVELSHIDVEQAVDRKPLLRASYLLLGVVILSSLYVLFSPKDAFSSVRRLIFPASLTPVATRTHIENVSPEDADILAGTLLTVEADILGEVPEQVTLYYTTADRKFVDQPVEMRPIETGMPRHRGVIIGEYGRGLLQDLTYRLVAGDAQTREYEVRVVQPPSARVESLSYTYPAYMKMEPRTQSGGHIDAWEGTTVKISATANMPVESAHVVLTDNPDPQLRGEEIRMQIEDGRKLTAEWKLGFRADGTYAGHYHIRCRTKDGQTDPAPTQYTIKIRPDQRPEVELLDPVQDLERPANAIVPLFIRAADPDFQLRFLTLRVEQDGTEVHSAEVFEGERPSFEGRFDLRLEDVGDLEPGDEIQYWIEARDNKMPFGNRTNTPRLKITIVEPVSEKEAEAQFEEDKQAQQERLQEAEQQNNPEERPQQQQEGGEEGGEPGQPEQAQAEKPMQDAEQQPQENGEPGGESQQPGEGEGDTTQLQDKPQEAGNESEQNPSEKNESPEEQQNGSQKDPTQKNEPPKNQPGEQRPGEQRSGEQPGGEQQANPEGGSEPKPGEQPEQKPEPQDGRDAAGQQPSEQGTDPRGANQKDPGRKPQPNQQGNDPGGEMPPEKTPQENQPGGEQTPQEQKQPSDQSPSGQDGQPGAGEQNQGKEDSAKPEAGENATGQSGTEPKPNSAEKNPAGQAGEPGQEPRPDESPMNPETGEGSQPPENGEETPAEDSPNAVKRQADGNEQGEGTPEENPTGDEPKSDQVKRKPGTEPKPHAKGGDNPDPSSPGDPQKGSAENPPNKPPKPDNGQPPNPEQSGKPSDQPREKRDGQGTSREEMPKGQGRPEQRSQRPDTGEEGGSAPQTEGKEGGNEEGPGEQQQRPGEQNPGQKPNGGESGQQKGPGSKSQPQQGKGQEPGAGNPGDSDAEPGKQADQPANQQPADGQANEAGQDGQAGQQQKNGQQSGKPGENQGQPGQPPEGARGNRSEGGSVTSGGNQDDGEAGPQEAEGNPEDAPEGKAGKGNAQGEGNGESDAQPEPEEANAEYARKASNLVLERLKDDLERGEVDQELLEKLGWTKDDLQKFAERLERNLQDTGEDQSPEAQARRRQFESMLESLNLSPTAARREGKSARESRAGEIGSRKIPVPAEYRELYEAYTRSLSEQGTRK